MALGPNSLPARGAFAFLFGVALLGGCGDGASEPSGSESSAAPEVTNDTATTDPTAETSTSETPPAVEPATGLKLKHDLATLTMPKGWKRTDNHGVPFLRQGQSIKPFGIMTFIELPGALGDPVATSLDAIAKRELRLTDSPDIRRVADVVIGGDTMSYRLVGMDDKYFYAEKYGVLLGDIEYSVKFSFSMQRGTEDEAIAIIESILATWEFNP